MRTTIITIITFSLFVAAPATAAPQLPACIGPHCASPTVDLWPTCCFTGPKGSGTCKDLDYLAVCAIDSYCCSTEWDQQCISEFESITELVCPPIFHGVYTQSSDAEVAAWSDDVCGPSADPIMWHASFELPASRAVGRSLEADPDVMFYDEDGLLGGSGGHDQGEVEIVYNRNNVIRGALHADLRAYLDDACEAVEEAFLFELRPQWTFATCHAPHATPGCNDLVLQEFVCRMDPWCCEHSWDAVCVAEVSLCEEC